MNKFIAEILFKDGTERVYTVDLTKGVKEYGENTVKNKFNELINEIVNVSIRDRTGATLELECGDMTHIINVNHIADFAYKFQ